MKNLCIIPARGGSKRIPRKKIKLLMNELNIDENYLDVTKSALEKSEKENLPVIALKINKKIITTSVSHLKVFWICSSQNEYLTIVGAIFHYFGK